MMAQLRKVFKRSAPVIDPAVVGKGEVGWGESQLYSGNIPKYNPDYSLQ